MKDCEKIRAMLSEYIDGVLPEAETSEVRSHLDECAGCMEMHRSMREIIVYMNDMEEVDPPAGFVGRVNERLKSDSSFGRIIRGIFHPLHIKVPIEIAGLAAAVVLIVYISGFVGKQGLEDVLPVGTGGEVAATLDGEKKPGSTSPEIVYESAAVPVAESAAPSAAESATTPVPTESEKKKTDAGIEGQTSREESESGESRPVPEFAGTTEEILVEAPVKQIKIGDSGVRYKVTSDELEELPVDDVVEALALKGGIVRRDNDVIVDESGIVTNEDAASVRGGSASTDLPGIDSSPDSIMAVLSRAVDMLGGRIIDDKKIALAETGVDATRVRAPRHLAATKSSDRESAVREPSAAESFAGESSVQPDSLAVPGMRPVEVIVPRSELERIYMTILRIGSVRPVEMVLIAEEGDSVRLRIEFP